MKTCKNPECGKVIPDNLNYCNEDCLKKHMEIKERGQNTETVMTKRVLPEKVMEEIRLVFRHIGRTVNDTNISGDNLAIILKYIIEEGEGDYKKMINKLALSTSLHVRDIRENYINPLESWDIIAVNFGSGKQYKYLGITNSQDLNTKTV